MEGRWSMKTPSAGVSMVRQRRANSAPTAKMLKPTSRTTLAGGARCGSHRRQLAPAARRLRRVRPRRPAPATAPAPAPAQPWGCSPECAEECGTDTHCLASCEAHDMSCFGCLLGETLSCGLLSCVDELTDVQDCLAPCIRSAIMLRGSFGSCMESICGEPFTTAATCLNGVVDAEGCAPARETCGL